MPRPDLPNSTVSSLRCTRRDELGDLLIAAVEIAAGVLGEGRQAQPRMGVVDGAVGSPRDGRAADVVHVERACMKSSRRRANSGVTCPPGSCVKCSDLNLSGTSASAALVASMQTGRMNTAPSAMLRERSMA